MSFATCVFLGYNLVTVRPSLFGTEVWFRVENVHAMSMYDKV